MSSKPSERLDLIAGAKRLHIKPPRRKFLMVVLATYADGDGLNCFPSVDTLASDVGTDRRAVQRDLRALEDQDLIRCVTPESGRGKPRGYILKIPAAKGQQTTLDMGGIDTAIYKDEKGGKKAIPEEQKGRFQGGKRGGSTHVPIRSTSITSKNIEPLPSDRAGNLPCAGVDLPTDSDVTISQIAKAHPRHEKPVVTEQAIAEAIDRLTIKLGSHALAIHYALIRTQLYAHITSQWPPGEEIYIVSSARWYRDGCYDEDEKNWERHSNGNGQHVTKADRKAADTIERTRRIFSPAGSSSDNIPDCLQDHTTRRGTEIVAGNARRLLNH